MSPEKAEKDPGPSLEVDRERVVDAPLSDFRLKTGLSDTVSRF